MKYLLLSIILVSLISCNKKASFFDNKSSIVESEERIPMFDQNGNQLIDVLGKPMFKYPGGVVSIYDMNVEIIEPDCDSLNGSIILNYPD